MDLSPDIHISLIELNQRVKQRALAVLAAAGIESLDALGGSFWADILFVTGYGRSELTSVHLEALEKASAGLGYGATQYALLSLKDLGLEGVTSIEGAASTDNGLATEAGSGNSDAVKFGNSDTDKLKACVIALGAEKLVFLEEDLTQAFGDSFAGPVEEISCVQPVSVRAFFDSLEAGEQQQKKKQQAWKELQPARRQAVMG
jgi:hypothetical protein